MTMPALDCGSLFAYRVRPLDPATLLGTVAVAALAGTWMIPAAPPPPPEVLAAADVTTPLAVVAVALSLAAGFVGGRGVDAAERLLFSAPTPHRRAIVLRVLLWGAVSAAIVWGLGSRAETALDAGSSAITHQGLVNLLFCTSVVLALARVAGPFTGGGIALTVMLALAGAPSFVEGFPLHPLAAPGSAEWSTTAPRLVALGAALLALTFWRLGRNARS
jgi:hypothetical protein